MLLWWSLKFIILHAVAAGVEYTFNCHLHYYVKVYGSKHICMWSLKFSWILQNLLLKTKTVKHAYNRVTGMNNFTLLQA